MVFQPEFKDAVELGIKIGAAAHSIAPLFNPQGVPGFVLGYHPDDPAKGAVWDPRHQQGHALTFGTSRQGGKGVNTIIPALLSYTGSMVVIDPKGENAWITAERRRQLGQRVVIIDPWGEVNRRYGNRAGNPETVTRFNPLSALRADDPEFADDVAAIADALVIPSGNDPHWSDSAVELIAGLIAAQVADKPGKASLRKVRGQLTMSDDALALMVVALVEAMPDSLAARKLGRFVKATAEVASIRSTAMTQTAILDSPALLDAMETDVEPFELAAVAREKVTVYLVIPPARLQTHGRWLRMILTLLIRAVSREERPPALPVVFLVDEAGTLNPVKGGGLKMLEQAFGLLAGLGVVVWMFFQDLNQMQRDYPDSWGTFIANSAVIQVLNARDNVTSNYFSDFVGESILIFPGQTLSLVNQSVNSNTREVRFKPLTGQAIRMQPNTEQLIFYPGEAVIKARKVPYFRERRWNGLYRFNPLFPSPAAPPEVPPVASVEEARTILTAAGYQVSAPGLRVSGWKVISPKGAEHAFNDEDGVVALAQRVRAGAS